MKKGLAMVEEDGKIVDIINAATVPSDCPEAIVDLSHCTIMPPLFDCSVDLASSASLDLTRNVGKSRKAITAAIARHIHFCHSHGVLGMADYERESIDDVSLGQRRGVDEAVTVKTAGPVYSTSEHCALNSESKDLDFVKIVHTGDIESIHVASDNAGKKENENLHRLVRAAHDRGKKTVVLANGEKGVREALHAECDALEQGYEMGEENLEIMASRKILWIPSLMKAKTSVEVAPASQKAVALKQLKKQQVLLRRARRLDIPTAVGTGAGSPGILHGEAVIEEIQQFIKSGYSLVEALRAASLVGADFFKIPGIGVLQAGGWANFIVSRGMVQQLPRKLFYLENIYWNGKPSQGYRKNPVKTVSKS